MGLSGRLDSRKWPPTKARVAAISALVVSSMGRTMGWALQSRPETMSYRSDRGRMGSPSAIHRPCESDLSFWCERIHVIGRNRAAVPSDHDPLWGSRSKRELPRGYRSEEQKSELQSLMR